MRSIRRIYVAATNQHIGKTTCTLGLIAAFQQLGLNVGYCKPVGQKFLDCDGKRADKDAFLFANFMGFEVKPEWHSPVILGPGAVTSYLDHQAQYNFKQDIQSASSILERQHDLVVYEGTGHPGVGSVVDVSNADVAHMLGAGVILIAEAGIGSAIDQLTMSMALFEQKGVPILGVILNKAFRHKLEKVRYYVQKKLDKKGIPLLGVIPFEETLKLPILRTIQAEIKGKNLFFPEKLHNRVHDILAGSLIDLESFKARSQLLLVVSGRRLTASLEKITHLSASSNLSASPLSGVVITGTDRIDEACKAYVRKHQVPVIYSPFDTYESVLKISKMEVKIDRHTPWKMQKAVSLFKNGINIAPLIQDKVQA